MRITRNVAYASLKRMFRWLVPRSLNGAVFGGRTGLSRTALSVKAWLERGVDHDLLYDRGYYERQDEHMSASGRTIASSLVGRFGASSVVDIGCGSGAVLNGLQEQGCKAWGLEYSIAAVNLCRSKGLSVVQFDIETDSAKPEWLASADVVVSTEVAEHLPEQCADRYVELCLSLSSKWVIVTAAIPGQGGTDHVNEQPHSYWIEKFQEHGACYCQAETMKCRAEWASGGVDGARARNVLVFQRGDR